MFAVEAPKMVSTVNLTSEKDYLMNLRVYTSKNLEAVEGNFVNFFEAVDIDQNIEDSSEFTRFTQAKSSSN
jgi:hypothetical protein